jgi:serine/threonine-protein kinase HipA
VQSLPIYFSDARVGELTRDHGRLGLCYASAEVTSISRRLPARAAPYSDEDSRAFIANLLPEGDWRSLLCRRLALPPGEDFGLLERLGHDCAGAVMFAERADDHSAGEYTPIDEAELRRWLKDPLLRPSPQDAPGLRRALAGAQDKLILHVAEGEAYLCERGAPSTVILKPDIVGAFNGVELSALNELFCMQLARAVGLRAPRSFWFAGSYGVERFDRVLGGSRLARLHQEDFAQLLGVLPGNKYEVGWAECFAVVDQHLPDPEAARKELVERLLFNLLIGNADAHCKNFALLFSPGGVELAPVYDVLCTQVYASLSDSFVMKVGPARRQSQLSAAAWQEFARSARLPLEWIKQRGAELSSSVQLALRDLGSQISSQNPQLVADISPARRREDLLHKLADIMVGNCKRISRSLLARA